VLVGWLASQSRVLPGWLASQFTLRWFGWLASQSFVRVQSFVRFGWLAS
jgi:hypothetical protein